jgi:hypothetical protein
MFKGFKIELADQQEVTTLKYADGLPGEGNPFYEIPLKELYRKTNQNFNYSNGLFTDNAGHPPYLKAGSETKSDYFFEKFQETGFADISSFGICNMGSLGHGVFAARDFEPMECFILYSGVISGGNNSKENHDYSLKYRPDIELCVNAAKVGNIARFIQHMPINFKLRSEFNQTYDNLKVNDLDETSSDYWQWRNLNYINVTESDIAWANLMFMVIPIQKIPCIVLFNTHKINKGEQLGQSYGYDYWANRNIKPELFDLKGQVIPKDQYGYKEIIVRLPIMKALCQFPMLDKFQLKKNYTASVFKQDLERRTEFVQPVWFNHLAEPISIFKLRELLIADNVISSEFHAIENELAIDLRRLLPSTFTVKIYERTPHKPSQRPIYDIVCHTDNLLNWAQLTQTVKSPMIIGMLGIATKCLKLTQEVVLLDVPLEGMIPILLISALSAAKESNIFKSKVLIPDGPVHNDPVHLYGPISEESISQVLLHNPKLTKSKIANHYDLIKNKIAGLAGAKDDNEINRLFSFVEMLSSGLSISDEFNEMLDSNSADNDVGNKDIKLTSLTSIFFQEPMHSAWKLYPENRLAGNYIGHQVRFFTMPVDKSKKAEQLTQYLREAGFDVSLKKANDKPSIVVDLTTSVSATRPK